jgi:hypothetical protein
MLEFFLTIGIVGILFLLPPILAILALRQFKTADRPVRWRVALVWAVLSDWILLVAFCVLHERSKVGWRYTTRLADGFLLLTLLLLIGAAVNCNGRWKLSFAIAVLLCSWTLVEQLCAFGGKGSSLSVLITMAADKVALPSGAGLPPWDSTYGVLHKMESYQEHGYYDAAINAGEAWTSKNPSGLANEAVLIGIASVYLRKARHDQKHAEAEIREALRYRDEALKAASDPELGYSMSALRDLALISEYAGDLSSEQRCIQYGNAIKLYEHLLAQLTDKKDEISRRFVPDNKDLTVADVDCLADETHDAMAQIREKQQRFACQ